MSTEAARTHLKRALEAASDETAISNLRAALDELDTPDALVECPRCGRVGLPERMSCGCCE